MRDFQFFDTEQEVSTVTRQLPHWSQAGTLTFITWRTADSLPRALQDRLTRERQDLLRRFGLNTRGTWQADIHGLQPSQRGKLKWQLFEHWDDLLNSGAGACVLRQPELAAIVEESLMRFDEQRYILVDAVVMPNHVHLLAAFPDNVSMATQCESWKRFTSRQINMRLNKHGEFWQVESFDHLVRSEDQFEHFRRYIAENGAKAGLKPGEYRWMSKELATGEWRRA